MSEQNLNHPSIDVKVSQLDENSQLSDNTPRTEQTSVLKPLDFTKKGQQDMKPANRLAIILIAVAIVAGVGTGFGINKLTANSTGNSSAKPISTVPSNGIKAGDVFGSPNESDFKDTATGYLEKGGLDGEGSHKLLRPGGETQTVYLTSSVTDLDEFEGMEIQIWGETFKAQKAGWLMDVGRVKVINTEAEKPSEE